MLVIDSHLDLAWNAMSWERDQTASVMTIRQVESPMPGKGRGVNTVALPEMRGGRVVLSFAALLSRNAGQTPPGIDYASVAQCHAAARGRVTPSDTVAVLGCGAVGLGAVAGAAERRARVIAVYNP